MINAISLRTEPQPGPLADAAYAIAATATINRTAGTGAGGSGVPPREARTRADDAAGRQGPRAS